MKIVILDRDGVINHDSKDYIKSADEWLPIEGSIEAIARLSRAGLQVVVATNQSGLARGLFDQFALAQIHHKMCHMVEEAGGVIDGIFFCPHKPDDNCDCRKPGTGLLQQISREMHDDLKQSWFIGDSLKDLQAGRAYGCIPVLVQTGNGLTTQQALADNALEKVAVFADLATVTEALLAGLDQDE